MCNFVSPYLEVIAGPNGAGKSTVAPLLLKEALGVDEFVNADVIAQRLSAFNPQSTAIEAGKIMLNRLHRLAEQKKNFAFETTLASRSFYPWIVQLQEQGYRFHLLYLWLPSPELAIARVQERVAMGGHHLPEDVIRRRFEAGLRNFFNLYMPIADEWRLIDNTEKEHATLIAKKIEYQEEMIYNSEIWIHLKEQYANANKKE